MHTVYDRRATEVIGPTVTVLVDDPYEAGVKLRKDRMLRDDPLARLWAHRQIDDAQAAAGERYQKLCELREIAGVRAFDPTKEPVDGGAARPEPYTDRQRRAIKELAWLDASVRWRWGARGLRLLQDVLIDKSTMEEIASARGYNTDRARRSFAWLFSQCLEVIAEEEGYTMPRSEPVAR